MSQDSHLKALSGTDARELIAARRRSGSGSPTRECPAAGGCRPYGTLRTPWQRCAPWQRARTSRVTAATAQPATVINSDRGVCPVEAGDNQGVITVNAPRQTTRNIIKSLPKTERVRYSPASAHNSYSQPYYTPRTVLYDAYTLNTLSVTGTVLISGGKSIAASSSS